MNLTSDTELADTFGISVDKLHQLRRQHRWPCVKLGRFDIRFTDEQVSQIVALHSETPAKPKTTVTAPVTGQTAKSASRRRAG